MLLIGETSNQKSLALFFKHIEYQWAFQIVIENEKYDGAIYFGHVINYSEKQRSISLV